MGEFAVPGETQLHAEPSIGRSAACADWARFDSDHRIFSSDIVDPSEGHHNSAQGSVGEVQRPSARQDVAAEGSPDRSEPAGRWERVEKADGQPEGDAQDHGAARARRRSRPATNVSDITTTSNSTNLAAHGGLLALLARHVLVVVDDPARAV